MGSLWKCVTTLFVFSVIIKTAQFETPAVTVESVEMLKSQLKNMTSGKSPDKVKDTERSSLAFVFDVTGSMYDDLRQLREGAHMILDAIVQNPNAQISNFVLVPFEDPGYGPAIVTEDRAVFKEALDALVLGGGGDCPEMSLSGLREALDVSRPMSYVYVFTDASATDHFLLDSVLDRVQRKQSQVVFILTGDCKDREKPSFQAYHKIAAASSGQVFNLQKTNVHKVLQFVKSSVAGRRVNLGSVTNPAGYNYTQAVPVDSSLGEVTVSVSGSDPQIRVIDPSGEEVTGPPKLVKTLDLDAIMVVNLVNPEPGNWSITVGSRDPHSVKVTGLSDFTFQHGFSVQPPRSMREASHRPLQGADNYLMVSPTETAGRVDMKFAEIVSTNGTLLFELPMRRLDESLYLAGPFVPPIDFFYIAINGVDENKNRLRRIGATAVQPQLPDVPFLTVRPKIEAHLHETVVLKCEIESLVPVSAQWFRGNKRLQDKVASLQSTSVEYVIQDMDAEKEDSYRCVSSNVAGWSKSISTVTLLVEPPVVTLVPDNVTVPAHSSLEVTCSVRSQASLTSFYFEVSNGDETTSACKDIPARVGDVYVHGIKTSASISSKFVCLASNRGGESSKTSYVEVLKPLKAMILDSKQLMTQLHGSFNLTCRIENGNSIQWIDPGGSVRTHKENIGIVAYDSVYIVHDVQLRDSGKWTCVTSRGTEKVSDKIDVILKPIVQTSNSMTVLFGQDVTINCSVTATAPVRITWTNHNRENFPSNVSSSQNEMEHTSNIIFYNVTNKYEGTYYCAGENLAGNDTGNFTLHTWQKQSILNISTDMNVEIYSSERLICSIQSHPPSVIRWYHNGTALGGHGNNEEYFSSIIEIYNMDFNKTGQYTCVASNSYETSSYNVSIGISGLETPEIDKTATKIVAIVGASKIIPCRLLKGKPAPNFSWKYRSQLSPEFVDLKNKTSYLNFTNLGVHQAGTYRCSADNTLGSDFCDWVLVVQFPPRLEGRGVVGRENSETLTVREGGEARLACGAAGEPTPFLTWTKDGLPLVYSINIHLEDKGSVVISSAGERDAGAFVCTATSSLGTARKNFTLIVIAPPIILDEDMRDLEIEVVEGSLVELRCSARGLPRPRLQWRHDNLTVVPGGRKQLDDDFTLRFVANLTDFGEYICTAVNDAGEASLTYLLLVWAPPYMDLLFETIESEMGEAVALRCDAVGFPVPTIHWRFEHEELPVNSTEISYNDTGHVSIRSVSSEHEGSYVCSAQNRAGVAQKFIRLNVNQKPVIAGNSTEIMALSSDAEINIPCVATGKPRPHVVWSKDGSYLDRDRRLEVRHDGSLTVRLLTEDMGGRYTCEASNRLGRATRTHLLRVYTAPRNVQMDETLPDVVMVEGTNDTLHCNVKHSDLDTVRWYKEGQLIGTGELNFTNVSRADAASYACAVSSAAGAASSAVRLRVEWPPTLVGPAEHPGTVEVVEGDDLYLNCETDARPKGQTKWFLDSKRLPGDGYEKLELRNVKLHHAGGYMCVVANAHGVLAHTFNVSVLSPPVISTESEVELDLEQGSFATLQCSRRGHPAPVVTWLHNNTDWLVQNGSLVCKNTTKHSEGMFLCISRNKAGVASLVYKVNVLSPATVNEITIYNGNESTTVLDIAEVEAGKSVRISCSGEGAPMPEVEWSRNGRTVGTSDPQVYYADLSIRYAQKSDEGVYICIVANHAGRQERTIHLHILTKPKIFKNIFSNPNVTNQEKLEVTSGHPFRLHCHPYGEPIPSIYWFRDGSMLRFYDRSMYTEDFGEVLVASSSTYEQSGNYTCVAKNKVGEDSVNYLVDVLVPPQSDLKNNASVNVRTKEGLSVSLMCPSQGNPAPHIIWLKHPYNEITLKQFPKVTFEENNSTMVLNNATSADSGKYTCLVTNRIGTLEVTFEVVVERPPVILTNGPTADDNFESLTVPLKKGIVLKCPVDGFPQPTITWWKDTMVLSANASRAVRSLDGAALAVADAGPHDAGQYICVAESAAGTAHRRYNVRVTVPGEWSKWSAWSLCNATCGRGAQRRTRLCRYLAPVGLQIVSRNATNASAESPAWAAFVELDEAGCGGEAERVRPCYMPPCEDEDEYGVEAREEARCAWTGWSAWGACSATCGGGTRARRRRCRCASAAPARCRGADIEIRKCSNLPKCSHKGEDGTNPEDQYLPEMAPGNDPEENRSQEDVTDEHESSEYEIGPDTSVHTVMCQDGVMCGRTLGSSEDGNGANEEECGAGFKMNPSTGLCEDIDECLTSTDRCHSTQLCENSAGGYRCFCQPGYSSLGPGRRCLDINECELDAHRCEYACVNTAGGYVCACPRPLRLHADRHTCMDPRLYREPQPQPSVYQGVRDPTSA